MTDESTSHAAFGELRELLAGGRQNFLLYKVLNLAQPVFEESPGKYLDEWLPYIQGFKALLGDYTLSLNDLSNDQAAAYTVMWPDAKFRAELFYNDDFNKLGDFDYIERLSSLVMSDFRDEECYLSGDFFGMLEWKNLKRLDLLNLHLSARTLRDMFEDAANFPALECLVLSGNPLGDEVAKELAESGLNTLRTLKLNTCKIGDEGARALASASSLSKLSKLDLGCNHITDVGAKDIFASPHLVGLDELDLSYNNLGMETVELLPTSGVAQNIQRLYLQCYSWDEQTKKAFASYRERQRQQPEGSSS